jgi:excisionase family DNA binding protein
VWMTIAALAEELCVSPRTLLRWIERGDVPAVRLPGGLIRTARCELDAALTRWATQPRRMLAAFGGEGGDGADRERD